MFHSFMMDVVACNFDRVNQMWSCILHLPTSTNPCIFFTFLGNTKRHNAQNTKHPKPMLSTNSNQSPRRLFHHTIFQCSSCKLQWWKKSFMLLLPFLTTKSLLMPWHLQAKSVFTKTCGIFQSTILSLLQFSQQITFGGSL